MNRAEGAAAARDTLEALAAALRQAVEHAVGREAELLAEEARRRCPRDTGGLRGSIEARVSAQGSQTRAEIGSSLKYAADVELGTLNSPPAPFLAPAYDARRNAMLNGLRQAVRGVLEGKTE